jgi:hypothetical protein
MTLKATSRALLKISFEILSLQTKDEGSWFGHQPGSRLSFAISCAFLFSLRLGKLQADLEDYVGRSPWNTGAASEKADRESDNTS